ncbi:GNAT family N-acetyltransferase [Corynebacterium pelargi]|uniref:Uncharacterized protein n=1 Tax=Corynebacterium pelargi TaxID=1471400 RepID=A0A410W789_9CORY|nr:GNAT family N-acetyltransferase [Corynebacterium pelargi]QAU51746.1 hypothetical protein CPELA_02265 [Corynebacterium pelargi]GGG80926.1 N-acetyltransferase [Corynebacterium pelargi]
MSDQPTEVRHESVQSRFAIFYGDNLAGFAEYVESDGVRDFNHTVVLEDYRGRGLSKPLIREALDATREEGLKVKPSCSAVAKFIEKNPEYAELKA